MDNISKCVRNHLRGKLAWLTAISLLPMTLYACVIFYITLRETSLTDHHAYGIVVIFFAGVCLDLIAHVICCINGSCKAVRLRTCAISFETISIFICLIWLCAYIKESINDKYMTPVYYNMAVAAFILLILVWRILEVISLRSIERCLIEETESKGITLFGIAGIILSMCFSVIALAVWKTCSAAWSLLELQNVCIESVICICFTSVPVYVFSLALQFLKIKETVDIFRG